MYSTTCGKLGLTLSPKSELCTSDFKLSLLIVKILKKEGVHYRATHDARDLGITYTAGLLHKNNANIIRHRFLKTSKCNTKICRIAKNTKRARTLFSGSQYSANTWGHQVTHLADTQIDSLENAPSWPQEFRSQADVEPSH